MTELNERERQHVVIRKFLVLINIYVDKDVLLDWSLR